MKARAFREFDQMVAAKEREVRTTMKAAGAAQFEIEAHLEACRANLAEQRAGVGRLVTLELMKAGVPLQNEANDDVRT